jgi:hypothetical protein
MVFALHRHDEYWALIVGLSFAIYPLVPKLPESRMKSTQRSTRCSDKTQRIAPKFIEPMACITNKRGLQLI